MLALALVAQGCAPMGVGPAAVTDVPRGSEERALATGAFQGTLKQSGTELAVRVERLCNVERFDLVERTTVRGYENKAPESSVWTGIGGALFAGLGATLVASPTTFGDASSSSNTQVRASGIGVLAVGAALLAIPAIDYARAHREADRKVERVAEAGPMLRHGEACGAAAAGTRVSLELAGNETTLGAVNERGLLEIDLDHAVPSTWHLHASDRAFVKAEESGIGELELGDLYVHRETKAWAHLAASPCLETSSCDGERDYVRDWPEGTHAKDAADRITAAAERSRAEEEEKAWQAVDIGSCAKPAPKSTSSELETACRPLRAFATAYPASAHASEFVVPLAAETALRTKLEAREKRALATARPAGR